MLLLREIQQEVVLFLTKSRDLQPVLNATQSYRAITRHSDGRIIHVRDIEAHSDAEAIRIVTARGSDIRTDLWSDSGLIQRFGVTVP